mmetsp:Transcript_8479/g.12644  ORF Transcript_8479/g.12644 Transcript_8479/m.12644 type:complete len:450 (-) Transcript_8479:168-1517(-)
MGKNTSGGACKKFLLIATLLIIPWCAWMGWNGIISIPAWLYLGAVFITQSQPGSELFTNYVNYVDWAATQLIPEPLTWDLTIVEDWTPDDFSYEKLQVLSKNFLYPVIFRGMGKNISRLEAWSHPEYFAERYGNTSLLSVRNPLVSKQREAAQRASQYGATDDTGTFSAKEVKLGDAIYDMLAGKDVYLQNVDEFVRRNPEIMEHMEVSRIFKNWKGGKPFNPLVVNWFMGFGKGNPQLSDDTTGTSLHCAMPANLFFQYSGRKQWWFVEPKWSPYVLGVFSKHVPAGFARRLPSYVPKAEVVLGPGDVMFNPSYMWHEVRNFEGWSLGAANRLMFPQSMIVNNPFAYFLVDLFGNPFTFSRSFYQDKPVGRFILDTPILRTLALLAKGNALEVPTDPTQNNCDEHNMEACSASIEQALMGTSKFKEDMEALKKGQKPKHVKAAASSSP